MSVSLQVLYPIGVGTTFDYEYYFSKHMQLVGEHMGPHIDKTLVTKGIAGGPDTAAGYYAIASIVFADQGKMDAAMQAAGPVMEDIPKFTNVQPDILIGEVAG